MVSGLGPKGSMGDPGRDLSLPWVTHRYLGATVAACGAGVKILAFLFLLYAMAFTAPQVIRFLAASNPNWNLVWLTSLVAGLVGVSAFLQRGRWIVNFLAELTLARFLLHAVPRYFAAATDAGMSSSAALGGVTRIAVPTAPGSGVASGNPGWPSSSLLAVTLRDLRMEMFANARKLASKDFARCIKRHFPCWLAQI
jgi:hypothetical protein